MACLLQHITGHILGPELSQLNPPVAKSPLEKLAGTTALTTTLVMGVAPSLTTLMVKLPSPQIDIEGDVGVIPISWARESAVMTRTPMIPANFTALVILIFIRRYMLLGL